MKRNQLKDLGLDEDQIKTIMDLNGEDINNAKSGNDAIVEQIMLRALAIVGTAIASSRVAVAGVSK